MSSKQPTPSGPATGRKKPFCHHPFCCLRPDCHKSYKSLHGLSMHFGKFPRCCNFKRMSSHNTRENTALQPPLEDAQESLTEYPWDKDDSLHKSKDASSVENSLDTAAPKDQAGVYTQSANDTALRFGVRFTTAQFHKTKWLNSSVMWIPHTICT